MQTNYRFRWLSQPGGGTGFLAVAAIVYGIACFLQGDFATPWQPVPDSLPLRQPLAYLSAGLLVLAGAGLLMERTKRLAAIALLALFAIYDALYQAQLVLPPHNRHAILGLAEQTSVVIGSWAILLRMRDGGAVSVTIARIGFGICSLLFAVAHLLGVKPTAQMIPIWFPGDGAFWAIATG